MALRKDLVLATLALVCVVGLSGCRSKAAESIASAQAPNTPSPYKGDPYTYGGVSEGSGGLVTTTQQTMESPSYDGAKFKQAAGPDEYTDPSSGHKTAKAKPSDISGDYQPLPNTDRGHKTSGEGEGH